MFKKYLDISMMLESGLLDFQKKNTIFVFWIHSLFSSEAFITVNSAGILFLTFF